MFFKKQKYKIVDRKRRIAKRGGLMIPLKLIEDLASSIEGGRMFKKSKT